MNNNISKYIQVFPKRVFVDIASRGCGNGCVYCFTNFPQLPQELLPLTTIDYLCDSIKKMDNCADLIISLCPNTEPMKSPKSRELILQIIQNLVTQVKIIQISTKEYIPIHYLKKLNDIARYNGQIRISVSVPYLDKTELLEPGAACVLKRLKNFANIHRFPNLKSILYLRPFNEQMIENKFRYVDLVNAYCPNDICIGAEFVPKVETEQLCTYMYDNSLSPEIFKSVGKEKIFQFVEFLRERTHREVFFSSVCNIANCSDYGCVLQLFHYDENYCKDCHIYKTSIDN